ncbi:MAG: hypothetical protein KGR48_09245 [Alphaproteobacteria bacterium]|nr:hypothetical protein [Alphaproteobacteria bacterium]MBU6472301.1 hypothetical protein [Alphaproteobacteria bacterium]MDE2011587.1 hypothetical protein [Alphaproteobacteria bacterium]MDE2071933.1 hypothetical protein [Alphaproteobacteria bacterium]MDE2353055.1 hypothetical protein [Alphaproteobacteria bacterium]
MRAGDLYQLAAELALEHGARALEFARRAVVEFESSGIADRACFWQAMVVLLDDIAQNRLDPDAPITIH